VSCRRFSRSQTQTADADADADSPSLPFPSIRRRVGGLGWVGLGEVRGGRRRAVLVFPCWWCRWA
jgi:hypothetical protein